MWDKQQEKNNPNLQFWTSYNMKMTVGQKAYGNTYVWADNEVGVVVKCHVKNKAAMGTKKLSSVFHVYIV